MATCINQPSQLEGKKIYEQLNTLYKYYETKYGTSSSSITSCTSGNNSFFMQLVKGKRQIVTLSKSELSNYLDINYSSYLTLNEIQGFDILKWWKSHKFTFPMLSEMTPNLLTPLVSTIAFL